MKPDDLRMNSDDFDAVMRKALGVPSPRDHRAKSAATAKKKPKKPRKK